MMPNGGRWKEGRNETGERRTEPWTRRRRRRQRGRRRGERTKWRRRRRRGRGRVRVPAQRRRGRIAWETEEAKQTAGQVSENDGEVMKWRSMQKHRHDDDLVGLPSARVPRLGWSLDVGPVVVVVAWTPQATTTDRLLALALVPVQYRHHFSAYLPPVASRFLSVVLARPFPVLVLRWLSFVSFGA